MGAAILDLAHYSYDIVYAIMKNKMEAGEKQLRVFLTFAMKIHTLWTYLGIKLNEIYINETYI